MLRPTENEIVTYRQQIITDCESKIDGLLTFGKDLFATMFPNARIIVTSQEASTHWPTEKALHYKSEEIRHIIKLVFAEVLKVCKDEDHTLPQSLVAIPRKMGELIIDGCLKIETFGRDLSDLDYYFLNDLGRGLNIAPREINGLIEQRLYKVRKKLFRELKPLLSDIQREISAWLLVRAIRADNRVHPAEIKYFEIVTELLDNDQIRLEQLESKADELEKQLPMILIDNIAEFLFKYLVEIVMCDKNYDPVESKFIKEIAKAFEFNQTQQDTILQPIAAALMVKTDLFQ
jgi:uncharacterized tellurite resistance protein B-like protein